MIGILVAAHHRLADALVETAHVVVPHKDHVVALGIQPDEDGNQYSARLRQAVDQLLEGHESVLIMTDMFGGTPSNIGLTMHKAGSVEIITGTNLPMLIKAIQAAGKGSDLLTVAQQVRENGRRAIAIATEVLEGTQQAQEASS